MRKKILDKVIDRANLKRQGDISAARILTSLYESAVRTANYMMKNPQSVPRRQIPLISVDMIDRNTYFNYFVVVVTTNSLTGEQARVPVNIISTERLSFVEVEEKAFEKIVKNEISRKYRNEIGPKRGLNFLEAVIISVHRDTAAE